jgi:hypothetical protein
MAFHKSCVGREGKPPYPYTCNDCWGIVSKYQLRDVMVDGLLLRALALG